MLTRRHAITLGAAGALTALFDGARADTTKLNFCSWGGALSDLEKKALLDPFAQSKGFEVVAASPTNYAKLKAMVEAGQPEWDLVDVGGRFIWQGADLLEPLDMTLIPNAKALDPSWVAPKGVFTATGATVIAWNTKAFPEGAGPKSWKDFWDVKTFPGPRGLYKAFYYNYEAALLAAGTPRAEIYPVTDDKAKLAIDKIRELKPNIKVWWTAGAQPPQLLSTGELAMSSAWSGTRPCDHEGKGARRHDVPRRDRLGQRLGGAERRAERQARHAGDQLRDLARGAGAASRFRPLRPRPRRGGGEGNARAAQNHGHGAGEHQGHADHQRAAGRALFHEIRKRLDSDAARVTVLTSAIRGERLQPLLAPRSIAFVGASARPNTPGCDMMRMIRRGGYTGTVFAVNPNHAEIEGYPCFASLADLPSAPDLAVLSVRNERLEETFAEAVARGAKAAVIFASGLLANDSDPPLARRLARLADEAGIPICGPNCMGFYNELDRVWICGFPSPREPAPGAIALIAHSGSVFGALAHNDPRLRFALAVSPGGEATATVADYIAYAVERPEVRVVGLFLETARDPRRLRASARTRRGAGRAGGGAQGRPHRGGGGGGAHAYGGARRQRCRLCGAVRPLRRRYASRRSTNSLRRCCCSPPSAAPSAAASSRSAIPAASGNC